VALAQKGQKRVKKGVFGGFGEAQKRAKKGSF